MKKIIFDMPKIFNIYFAFVSHICQKNNKTFRRFTRTSTDGAVPLIRETNQKHLSYARIDFQRLTAVLDAARLQQTVQSVEIWA